MGCWAGNFSEGPRPKSRRCGGIACRAVVRWRSAMAQTPRRVFFLIYDQVEILDLAGAYDVFTIANIASGERAFELHTVSPTKGAIGPMRHPAQPDRGLHLEATHTIDAWSDQPIDMQPAIGLGGVAHGADRAL